ncbi:MAG: rubrerythrin family protein [bacterium]|nr:rubrerythrin family protein [bacterium]
MEKTYLNVAQAYLGESQARNRYTFYASTAKKEGYEQIAAIFQETADQEREHGSNLFKWIVEMKKKPENVGDLVLDGVGVPNVRATTEENLQAAIAGELHEENEMYPQFADIADSEGYPEYARRMRAIAKAEGGHATRYQKLLKLVQSGFFDRETDKVWICRECGYIHVGKTPPKICPSCEHAQGFYEVAREEY